ncbi:hypothetical protein Dimus_011938 [Dionaea muscipula]
MPLGDYTHNTVSLSFSAMASPLYLRHCFLHSPQSVSSYSSSTRLQFVRKISRHLSHTRSYTLKPKTTLSIERFVTVSLALVESDSPKSIGPNPQTLLHELADSFDLPPDYFSKLPGDLRLELNDAAFDLSNGAIVDECGQDLGQTLLNLARAWESADTSTSHNLVRKLPSLASSLEDSERSAFGKRLISAGTRFQSMGFYGEGELQKIAESMITAGQTLSASSLSTAPEELPQTEMRVFKFGELQVAVTPEKAIIGAAIGIVFGILSWVIGQGIQSVPESSFQYANVNALLLAKSLRGVLLALFYSSAFLSGISSIALVLLARELKSKE